jgi:hypothetical protein
MAQQIVTQLRVDETRMLMTRTSGESLSPQHAQVHVPPMLSFLLLQEGASSSFLVR